MTWKEPPSADYQRTLAARRRAAGHCPRCGRQRERPDRKLCDHCRAYSAAQDRKRGVGWLKDNGICYRCKTRPVDDGYKSCAQCHRGIIERHKESLAEYNRRLRAAVLSHYGGRCACCDETEPAFLAIDHINGGGRQHRRGITRNFYRWIIEQGYPAELQLLCHNCNLAKGFYGRCPHQDALLH